MNIIHRPTAAISLPEDDDPYSEVANEGGGQFGKIIKYVKGTYQHGETVIPLDTEFLALVQEAMRGDVRFQDGKPVEQRIGFIRDRFKFAPRADLGFTDESQWERDKKGNPINPWSQQYFLPLIHCESGDLYCYIFHSAGGRQTFRDLARNYAPLRKTSMLPVVSLQTDRYNHPDYSWIDIPILKIERWEDCGGMAPPDNDGGASAKVVGVDMTAEAESKPAKRNSDMDDDIPF